MTGDRRTWFAVGLLVLSAAQYGLWALTSSLRQHCEREIVATHDGLRLLQQQAAAPSPLAESADAADGQTWRLLDGPQVVETLQALQVLDEAAGVTIDSLKALVSDDRGKQSFQLIGRGTPDAVCTLLRRIEGAPRLMIVESGKFAPFSEREVAFELGVATYHGGP